MSIGLKIALRQWTKQKDTPVEKDGEEKSSTMSKVFVDTNILVYASDKDSPEKRKTAKDILHKHALEAVISTQVVQEYYFSAVKKLKIDPHQAKTIITKFEGFEIIPVLMDDIYRAIDATILRKVSFWDALILAMAEKANCSIVYSEGFNPGQTYGNVTVKNPFL